VQSHCIRAVSKRVRCLKTTLHPCWYGCCAGWNKKWDEWVEETGLKRPGEAVVTAAPAAAAAAGGQAGPAGAAGVGMQATAAPAFGAPAGAAAGAVSAAGKSKSKQRKSGVSGEAGGVLGLGGTGGMAAGAAGKIFAALGQRPSVLPYAMQWFPCGNSCSSQSHLEGPLYWVVLVYSSPVPIARCWCWPGCAQQAGLQLCW
jgi:hypothetical protein